MTPHSKTYYRQKYRVEMQCEAASEKENHKLNHDGPDLQRQ